MGPMHHLKYSIFTAGVLLITTKSAKAAIGCAVSGVLVDLDHLIEYKNYCLGDWKWEEFITGSYFNKKGSVKVIFHSWEAAVAIWIVIFAKKDVLKNSLLYGIAVGYTLHLVLDQLGNNINTMGYFELYRWYVNWRQDKLTAEDIRTEKI